MYIYIFIASHLCIPAHMRGEPQHKEWQRVERGHVALYLYRYIYIYLYLYIYISIYLYLSIYMYIYIYLFIYIAEYLCVPAHVRCEPQHKEWQRVERGHVAVNELRQRDQRAVADDDGDVLLQHLRLGTYIQRGRVYVCVYIYT